MQATTILDAPNHEPAQATNAIVRHAPTAARVLLGLCFFTFGLDGFLNFIPKPDPSTMPPGSVRFAPLALALLAPVVVNIVLFHAFLAPSGLGIALVVTALHLFLAWTHRRAYRPMLAARAARSA